MRTVLAGLAVLGILVLANLIAAGAMLLFGSALVASGLDTSWTGLVVGLLAIAASLWFCKTVIEWLSRHLARDQARTLRAASTTPGRNP
jgi:hypothetical protein